ncbi:MAG: cell division protein ZapA [Bacteroidales bacterium]|jgi:cell division protein ZapA (FtsZ GTPase activity inhibitor)|nr:cell division protein ZapA [Bacteroidales bacterium]MCI2122140.1 cell division protein ZapA [Bacteroidales bacterium]MCI2146167.1 cell division protein ZapA [Bacteroidales bacterium]
MEERVKHKINVMIADRQYSFTLFPELEEDVRSAVDKINARVKEIRQQFTNKDVQDALSIAVLEMFVNTKNAEKRLRRDDISEELDTLNSQLEEYLKKTI